MSFTAPDNGLQIHAQELEAIVDRGAFAGWCRELCVSLRHCNSGEEDPNDE